MGNVRVHATCIVSSLSASIDTADLRVGMFVHLDLGWMSHPFALSSFRIADPGQIATIRSLGLARVRWSPDQSDERAPEAAAAVAASQPAPAVSLAASGKGARRIDGKVVPAPVPSARPAAAPDALAARRAAVDLCQRQYAEATTGWCQVMQQAQTDPQAAGQRLGALSRALVDKMIGARDVSIRVLAEPVDGPARHALNVSVVSLLLGKLCGLSATELHDLGCGALAHDLGKLDMPAHVRELDPDFSVAETALHREHVAYSVARGERMGLAPGALLVIAQHHELCDGQGFPHGLEAQRLSTAARLMGLVDRYDELCCPGGAGREMTPHEALSRVFALGKRHYDPTLLTSFVRMMGVYPPGSVVQLTDDRYALVDSVLSSRPLKPRVMVFEPRIARDPVLLLDLESEPALGIRRSLPAGRLPKAAREALMPPAGANWFFEAVDTVEGDEHAAPTTRSDAA